MTQKVTGRLCYVRFGQQIQSSKFSCLDWRAQGLPGFKDRTWHLLWESFIRVSNLHLWKFYRCFENNVSSNH